LAEDQQEKAICIILSGTGAHGTLGLQAVKANGGMAMVQDPGTAEYDSMPRHALATGLADLVLPPEQMPEALIKYAQHFYVNGGHQVEPVEEAPDQLQRILALLLARTRFDFRGYRKKMIKRRIERRMGLKQIVTYPDYLAFLRDHPEEVRLLVKDLLIGVTNFFRDSEAFKALETLAIGPLIESKSTDDLVRVWVPGCATGEEAYSIGMLLAEHLAAAHKSCQLQIFATDVDEDSLVVARQGIYPESIEADVSPERLAHFFTLADDHHYQVTRRLRESFAFAKQNLITHAPFSKLDLISCRNLFMYLEPEVQQKLIGLFHFALNPNGYLFLGTSETIGRRTDLFEPVSKRWRLYRRLGISHVEPIDFPVLPVVKEPKVFAAPSVVEGPTPSLINLTHRLMEEYSPAAVLINHACEILYFYGPTTRYLEQPSGRPTNNLLLLARGSLRSRLRAAIDKAIAEKVPVHVAKVRLKIDSQYISISFTVKPVRGPKVGDGLLLVVFEEETQTVSPPSGTPDITTDETLVKELEAELRASKEELQTTVEELESSNEELKASNEEVMSMNEELQSSNEELETSKEEMQSLNEELNTVNNQLRDKVEELETTTVDLINLLESTDVATIFLDSKFEIKRFTPTGLKLFNLIPSDRGRPLSDISARFDASDLLHDAEIVLRGGKPDDKQVRTQEGIWWIRRITPYRTRRDQIEGVVLTFADITQVKESREKLQAVLDSAVDAIITIDHQGIIESVNAAAAKMFGYSVQEMIGQDVTMLMPSPYQDEHDRYLENYLKTGIKHIIGVGREVRVKCKNGHTFPVDLAVSEIPDSGLFLGVLRDITQRKQLEKEVLEIAALEQRRIGQELHDGVGQELAGLTMMVDALAQQLKDQPPQAELAKKVVDGLQRLEKHARVLARGLIPVDVDPEGLRIALEDLAARTREQYGLGCTFELIGQPVIPNGITATHLFRIAQEALLNAIRHGQAKNIHIGLETQADALTLSISDDGIGLPEQPNHGKGLGIRIMRNRAGVIGATLTIAPAEGGGTLVTCMLTNGKKSSRPPKEAAAQLR
jgi:two-component system CheB/CheR fusion protein